MSTGENILFTVDTETKARKKTRRVFRTREAALEFRDTERAAGRKASEPERATWGPEQ